MATLITLLVVVVGLAIIFWLLGKMPILGDSQGIVITIVALIGILIVASVLLGHGSVLQIR